MAPTPLIIHLRKTVFMICMPTPQQKECIPCRKSVLLLGMQVKMITTKKISKQMKNRIRWTTWINMYIRLHIIKTARGVNLLSFFMRDEKTERHGKYDEETLKRLRYKRGQQSVP